VSVPRLLVLAPLRIEAWALGPARSALVGNVHFQIERTGMGLARATSAAARLSPGAAPVPSPGAAPVPSPGAAPVPSPGAGRQSGGPKRIRGTLRTTRLLSDSSPAPLAVALCGLGGDLTGRHQPGDIVVAKSVLDQSGKEVAKLGSAVLLAAEMRRLGLRATTGTVVSADHIVTGQERAELAQLGAEVVDMESAAVAGAPWGTPLAVVRAISDAPDHELFSAAGSRGVWLALRSLRAARPALAAWARAAGPREVLLAEPRGFCAGVRRAIETVERALHRYGAPVYVRRQIVHNAHVVARLEDAGATFVEELSEVPDGATVVFSAHGVGIAVTEEAARRGMNTIDATCPLVTKVHTEARRFAAAGRQLVLVGNARHDEVEGTLGVVPGIRLVSTPEDVRQLDLDEAQPTAVVTQTTLATDEVSNVIEALEDRFPDLARPVASDICYASQNRQEAVRHMAPDCDLVLVVGSPNSSNSNRLVEVAQRQGAEAHLVDSTADINLAWLTGAHRVGVSAGASAPEELVQEVLDCLGSLGPLSIEERSTGNEHVTFPLPQEIR
jgi:4-hydroxy-3-methylbut-2-enyl diphosphate reductase